MLRHNLGRVGLDPFLSLPNPFLAGQTNVISSDPEMFADDIGEGLRRVTELVSHSPADRLMADVGSVFSGGGVSIVSTPRSFKARFVKVGFVDENEGLDADKNLEER